MQEGSGGPHARQGTRLVRRDHLRQVQDAEAVPVELLLGRVVEIRVRFLADHDAEVAESRTDAEALRVDLGERLRRVGVEPLQLRLQRPDPHRVARRRLCLGNRRIQPGGLSLVPLRQLAARHRAKVVGRQTRLGDVDPGVEEVQRGVRVRADVVDAEGLDDPLGVGRSLEG